jgi:hypothetical protein
VCHRVVVRLDVAVLDLAERRELIS